HLWWCSFSSWYFLRTYYSVYIIVDALLLVYSGICVLMGIFGGVLLVL
ncbi:536_t:CDS:2, partial [Dentiscutata heterogama]